MITVQLVGGPHDGETLKVQDGLRTIKVPAVQSLSAQDIDTAMFDPPEYLPLRVSEYERDPRNPSRYVFIPGAEA